MLFGYWMPVSLLYCHNKGTMIRCSEFVKNEQQHHKLKKKLSLPFDTNKLYLGYSMRT